MSFVIEQIQRIDAHLDRAQLAHLSQPSQTVATQHILSPRVYTLQASIRALSVPRINAATSNILLKPAQIQHILTSALLTSIPANEVREGPFSEEGNQIASGGEEDNDDAAEFESELEWLLVSKATSQAYGHVLNRILATTSKFEDEAWYWNETLSSPRATALYSVQTSPLRLLGWGRDVWGDVVARTGQGFRDNLRNGWKEFYGLVKEIVKQRGVDELRVRSLGPLGRLGDEIRRKKEMLKKLRIRNANALGLLLGEGLAKESVQLQENGHGEASKSVLATANITDTEGKKKWRSTVARNVALMAAVLVKINDLETSVDNFDEGVGRLTDDDPLYTDERREITTIPPSRVVADRLVQLLSSEISVYSDSTQDLINEYGRPSRVVRYWLPVTVGILSSSTALRMLFNRKAQIVQNIQDLGATIMDFWSNWVVEPTRNLIKTIRHDEGSEISIISKRSLQGDRESLERMVVDFAIDNPVNATGSPTKLSEAEIADIRTKVREGDLTPILKAYEKDLASPLMGTLRGNLIRALLIQIQKTKVDVEIAMGGIDSLLKSQELCIGIIGLTPGLLVTYSLIRWIRSTFSEKRGSQAVLKQGKMLRQLRNIDRILSNSTPTNFGELMYKDQGLLLCEVHVLRQTAAKSMPGEIYREFGEEADELCDIRVGVEKQKYVANRIRWAYAKWLA